MNRVMLSENGKIGIPILCFILVVNRRFSSHVVSGYQHSDIFDIGYARY